MTYLYHIKRPETVTEETPILVTLHGMGSNYHDLSAIAGKQSADYIQIDVQGNRPWQSGYTYYVPNFSSVPEEQVILETLDALMQFLKETYQKEKLSENQPLYFLGFSQGAILSLCLGILYPQRVSGAVILSGRLPQFVTEKLDQTSAKPSFFIGQGQFDPLFPLPIGRALHQFLTENGYATFYHEYATSHGVNGEELVAVQQWLTSAFNGKLQS